MSLSRNVTGREFQRHGPATEKLLCNIFSHTVVSDISKSNVVYSSKLSQQWPTRQRLVGKYWKIFGCLQHTNNQEMNGTRPSKCTIINITNIHIIELITITGWLRGTAVERRSLAGKLSVLRSTCSWWVTTDVGKPPAICQPTRPTQPFIPSGSTDE